MSVRHIDVESGSEDQAGCSGVRNVPSQAEVKDTTIIKKVDDPLANAWTDLVERVSVAGWKEALDEKIIWIRGSFRIALIILSIICVYYISASLNSYFKSGYIDQIHDFAAVESLPFPNVTVCAQLYFNQTFIRHNLTIPNRSTQILRHQNVSFDDFYRQLTLFLTQISRPRNYSSMDLTLFSKVVAANPQLEDYSSFSTDPWLPCESMLRRCWFDGQEFDCCKKAVTSFDDDGICFQLALNMDSDNAFPDKRTIRQTAPGPTGGLVVEASIDTRDFPWLEDDAQNGFRVLTGHTPFLTFGTPVVAPHGAETFIKVTPEKRLLAINCAERDQLKLPFGNDLGYHYDPEGDACALHGVQETLLAFGSCHVAGFVFRPNRSIVCPPIIVYAASSYLAMKDIEEYGESLGTNTILHNDRTIKELFKKAEAILHGLMTNKAMCPKHCQRWTYSSSSSFFYLENNNNDNDGRMFSKLRIYYANLDYRQHEEVKESTQYLAFCNFGNIAMLYWGMSIVSFVHVFYYVMAYLYVRRRQRRIRDVPTNVLNQAPRRNCSTNH